MGNRKDVNGIGQSLIHQPIRKAQDWTGAHWPSVKRKPIRIFLNFCQANMDRMQELSPKLVTLTVIVFSRANEFDIRFTMVNYRLHEMACNAPRITSSAGRTFAPPE